MRQGAQQALDLSDPVVKQFVAECDLAAAPVSIRLVGTTAEDVQIQLDRITKAFGQVAQMTAPRQSGRGSEWIAYGTLLR